MDGWRDELAAQARLAGPVVTINLAMMMMGVVDTVMAGRLSTGALAAVGLGHAWVWCPMTFGIGVVLVLDPLVSQARGAGDRDGMARAVQRGLLLAVLVSLPIGLLLSQAEALFGFLARWDPLRLAGADSAQPGIVPPGIVADAAAYARVSALGVPFMLAYSAMRQSLQAMGHLRPIVLVAVAGNLVNVVFNQALMFGEWGFPALGTAGCAWASVIVEAFMVAAVLGMARPVVGPLLWPLRPRALAWRPLLRIAGLGLPIGVAISLEAGAFNAIQLLMGSFGDTVMAGHRAAIVIASLSYMVPMGLGTAAAVRVGRAVGAADQPGVRRAARVALVTAATVMVGFGLLFWLLPGPLARLFSDDPGVLAVTVALLPLAAAFQLFDGLQVVAAGVLRGTADTRWPSLMNFLGYWVLALPMGLAWLKLRGGGALVLWWSLVLGLALVAGLLLWRVRRRLATEVGRFEADEPDPGRQG